MSKACNAEQPQLEDVLCSVSRLKILKMLMRLGQLNVSQVAVRLRSNYEATYEHLKILESAGIVEQRLSGRTRYYRLKQYSARSKAVQELIEVYEGTRLTANEEASMTSLT